MRTKDLNAPIDIVLFSCYLPLWFIREGEFAFISIFSYHRVLFFTFSIYPLLLAQLVVSKGDK